MEIFIESHGDKSKGTSSCFERVVINGVFPDLCLPKAMRGILSFHGYRVFDFTKFVEPLRDGLNF